MAEILNRSTPLRRAQSVGGSLLTPTFVRLVSVAALLVWCVSLFALRVVRSGTLSYAFLIWNLFLAVIPAAAAFLVKRWQVGSRLSFAQLFWLGVWLVFLPNAPYMTTDFLHLHLRPLVPLWFDIALLVSFSATGLFLAYSSVADVQWVIGRCFGTVYGWLVAVAALFLSGFGIYLGRFLRWNSWDVIANPSGLLRDVIFDPRSNPSTVAVTAVYGAGLVLGYFALRAFVAGVADAPLEAAGRRERESNL